MGDRALAVTDIIADGWYDYHAKYAPGGSRHVVPAEVAGRDRRGLPRLRAARASGARLPRGQPHRLPLGRAARARRADPARDQHPAGHDADLAGARAGGACAASRSASWCAGWWRTPRAPGEGAAAARSGAVAAALPADPAVAAAGLPPAGELRRADAGGPRDRLDALGRVRPARAGGAACSTRAREAIIERPQFVITEIAVPDVSRDLAEAIRVAAFVHLPVSSLELDVGAVRARIESLDAVERARVRALPSGDPRDPGDRAGAGGGLALGRTGSSSSTRTGCGSPRSTAGCAGPTCR